ncbi:MAG: FAD-dependent oxidoreductase, partial [Victivallales bacterium]|nr:FAD-dependent oxidoreductase [Victivallales bacterium]
MQLGMTENGIGVRKQDVALRNPVKYYVVVIGLGTAGAEAYCHCVKEGLNVLGIEKSNGMGGQSTIGCISFGGLPANKLKELERRGRGGDIMYESVAIGAWMDNGKIIGIRVLSNGIIHDAMAKIVIDASGNASIARMCDLPIRKGRDYDGLMAPCSRAETWMNLETKSIHPWYRNYPEDLTLSMKDYSS